MSAKMFLWSELNMKAYLLGAIDAISAIDAIRVSMNNQTTIVVQMRPAVPPLKRPDQLESSTHSHVACRMVTNPTIDTNLKFLFDATVSKSTKVCEQTKYLLVVLACDPCVACLPGRQMCLPWFWPHLGLDILSDCSPEVRGLTKGSVQILSETSSRDCLVWKSRQ